MGPVGEAYVCCTGTVGQGAEVKFPPFAAVARNVSVAKGTGGPARLIYGAAYGLAQLVQIIVFYAIEK